jgi:hypothetical protein
VRCGCAAVVWERPGKGNADVKRGNVSPIRETQTKDRWRLRAANLNDIDGLHALVANPLVYRYLFDGAPPDKEFIGSSKSRASGACNAYQQAEGSDDLWNDDRANPRVSRTDLFVRLMEPVIPAEKNRKDCERNQAIQLHTPSPKEISGKRRKGCRKGTANGHEWTQKKTRRQEPESRSQEEAGSGEPRVMNRSEGSNQ